MPFSSSLHNTRNFLRAPHSLRAFLSFALLKNAKKACYAGHYPVLWFKRRMAGKLAFCRMVCKGNQARNSLLIRHAAPIGIEPQLGFQKRCCTFLKAVFASWND